ncbi:MAG TPA: CDP-alcohol phosphatidyltransferase family protein [Gemmatimonadales bacterium]|nr:CDP-alcohol phosphatidyltransferase family protein [Gemmatimonadales bacterium]
MAPPMVWTLPNVLTVARIALSPVIALLPFIDGYLPKLVAFMVFLAAAVSDIYDGRLARERHQITDLGKVLDPLADKLLLFATLVPIYWITHDRVVQYGIPWWGSMPLWVALLLVGRELVMIALRYVAQRRGVVIAADGAGKLKTIMQDIFIGATIGWFAWKDMRARFGWERGWFGEFWERFHGAVVAVTLGIAVLLTLYSLAVYLYRYRRLIRAVTTAQPLSGDGP